MATRTATGPNGEKVTFRSATDAGGNQQWVQTEDTTGLYPVEVKPKSEKPGQAGRRANAAANIGNKARLKESEQIESQYLPSQIEEIKSIEEMPFFDQTMLKAGETVDALSRGVMDTKARMLGNMLIDNGEGDRFIDEKIGSFIDKNSAINTVIDEKNRPIQERNAPLNEGVGGLASMIGGMLPSLITGSPTKYAGQLGMKAIASPFNILGKANRSGVLGKRAQREAIASRAEKPVMDADVRRRLEDIVGAPVIGAHEGMLNADEDVLDSMLSSTMGTIPSLKSTGLPSAKKNSKLKFNVNSLQRTPYKPAAVDKPHIDWYEKNVGNSDPGTLTGSRKLQQQEAGLRNDPEYADDIDRLVDTPNRKSETHLVTDAMGMSRTEEDFISSDQINKYYTDIGNEMDDLAAGTSGVIKPSALSKILADTGEIVADEAGMQNKSTINRILAKVGIADPRPTRDPLTGKPRKYSFSGDKYQEISSDISEAKNKMYDAGNHKAAKVLDYLQQTLDGAVENGVSLKYGTTRAADWKDVNERYAMSKLVLDNGMNNLGQIDPKKITSYLDNNDMSRMLKGQGGRVKDLHKLAQYHRVVRKQPGGGLTGSKIMDTGKDRSQTESEALGITPDDYAGDAGRGWRIKRRFSKYPTVRGRLGGYDAKMKMPDGDNLDLGVLGLSPDNDILNINRILRASSQGGDTYPKVIDWGVEEIDQWKDLDKRVEEADDPMKEILKWVKENDKYKPFGG